MGTEEGPALPHNLSTDDELAARRGRAQLRFEFEAEIKRLQAA
jgi:hypothetical protein